MLYVTTRNNRDTFTTHYVLQQSRGYDGGLYLPLHFPKLSIQDQVRLSQKSFGQCAAEFLNIFFAANLNGWDIDFGVGRYPVRLQPLSNRILMAEAWHNPQWQYKYLQKNLLELLHAQTDFTGSWGVIAVQMAVIAGILLNRDVFTSEPVDIVAVSGDLKGPISAWYLRKMGFPIGNIICCCNENNQFWELICNGQMRTEDAAIKTIVPEADVALPENLERLIYECGDVSETEDYLRCCATGNVYYPSDATLQKLRQGLFVSVISTDRVETTIPNVFKTHNYVLSPESALVYSGLMDYRAKTGINRPAVVLCQNSPCCAEEAVAKAMGIPVSELKQRI